MHLDGLGTTSAALAVRGFRGVASRAPSCNTAHIVAGPSRWHNEGRSPYVGEHHTADGLEDLCCAGLHAPRLFLFGTAQPCLADAYEGLH